MDCLEQFLLGMKNHLILAVNVTRAACCDLQSQEALGWRRSITLTPFPNEAVKKHGSAAL